MDDNTNRILEGFRGLPLPTPGFSALDLATVQPMTLPVLDLDIEFVDGPLPDIREEDNICTMGR